jgi:hypothetical protein
LRVDSGQRLQSLNDLLNPLFPQAELLKFPNNLGEFSVRLIEGETIYLFIHLPSKPVVDSNAGADRSSVRSISCAHFSLVVP